jgi:hypothetical protein
VGEQGAGELRVRMYKFIKEKQAVRRARQDVRRRRPAVVVTHVCGLFRVCACDVFTMKVNGRRVKALGSFDWCFRNPKKFAFLLHKLLVVVQQLPQPCLVVQLLVKLRPGVRTQGRGCQTLNGQHRQRA